MRIARFCPTAVAVNEEIFVFGGISECNKFVDEVEMFSMATNTWSAVGRIPLEGYRIRGWGMKAVAVGDLIYILGGACAGTYDCRRKEFVADHRLPEFWRRTVAPQSSLDGGSYFDITAVNNDKIVVAKAGAPPGFCLLDPSTHMMVPLPSIPGEIRRSNIGELVSIGYDCWF